MPIQFDPDFASTTEYAKLYRELGLQVVPSYSPSEQKSWKRPSLLSWKEFENTLVPQSTFDEWFGVNGSHRYKSNIGIITGACSNNAYIVDVDTHSHAEAMEWFMALMVEHNDGEQIICPTQRTGGGGFQFLLRGSPNWVGPTIKTPIGVDIRAQGGFAVMPSSLHESGKFYEWLPNRAPHEVDIPTFQWMEDAIDQLAKTYGSGSNSNQSTHTPSPLHATTPFGLLIDGREDYMTKLVWARIVALRRESPFLPDNDTMQKHMRDAYHQYERSVKSRINEAGTPNHTLLEREGRGHGLFFDKWRAALKQWEGKVTEAASVPNPNNRDPKPPQAPKEGVSGDTGETDEWSPPQDTYELLSELEIMALPDPIFLVDGIIPSQSLGFIYGAPGAGKSFVALSIGMAISTTRTQWWDRDIKAHGPVLMISSEGVADMKFRIQAWRKHHQVADQSDLFLIRQTINFLDPTDGDKLQRTVEALVERSGGLRPAMIVVDTLSRSIPGGDENDQASASLMVMACDALKERWQTVVMCIHHSSKAGAMRGSTVFSGAADFILEVTREEGAKTGILTARKIKSAADGWNQGFSLLDINLGSIENPTSSLVALPALIQKVETDEWPEQARIRLVLEEIQKAWDAKRPWSPYPQAKRTGTYVISNMARWNIQEEHAEKLLNTWMTNRILSYEIFDPKTKQKGLRVVGGEAGGEGRRSNGSSPPERDFG